MTDPDSTSALLARYAAWLAERHEDIRCGIRQGPHASDHAPQPNARAMRMPADGARDRVEWTYTGESE